jgi:hypothetical protein
VSRPITPTPTSAWPAPNTIDIVGAGAEDVADCVAEDVAEAVVIEKVELDIAVQSPLDVYRDRNNKACFKDFVCSSRREAAKVFMYH